MCEAAACGRFRKPAGLVDDNRLLVRDGAGRGHELSGFVDRLDVQDDRVGVGVGGEVVDQIAHADFQHVADRHEVREADIFLNGPIERRRAQRSRLRDERHATRFGRCGCEAGVQVQVRNDNAQRVRSQNAEVREARLLRF